MMKSKDVGCEVVNERTDSVEFSINAKGQWSGKVKVYKENFMGAYAESLHLAEKMSLVIEKKNKVGDLG